MILLGPCYIFDFTSSTTPLPKSMGQRVEWVRHLIRSKFKRGENGMVKIVNVLELNPIT